jgi:hypothetical protein
VKIKKSYWVIVVFFFLLGNISRANEFGLKINDISNLNSSWPLVASISFPKGELKDISAVRIMSGDTEIPSQVDISATWMDGTVRWALAGFTSSPQGNYRVEYGQEVKRRDYPNPLKVTEQANGGFTVNTGVAEYRFEKDKLLPEEGWLTSGGERIQILSNSGLGAYLVTNSGIEARVAGESAEVTNSVLKDGPNRFVIKRSGWYVTQSGVKVARADVWFYFSAGVPYIKITHSLILTEDTNKIWVKDYGLEFKTPTSPDNVYCATGAIGKEIVRKVSAKDSEIYMLQDQYPHFIERDSKAVIGSFSNRKNTTLEEMKVAGDWAFGEYNNFGITLVMPWLAERFPKEISFGARGARAVLWSNRSGRELDFRSETLAKEYWQGWADQGRGSPGKARLAKIPSNAQGSAGTHDIWFLPLKGNYQEAVVKKVAVAAARTPLVIADPEWLCETEALGVPMYHKDITKFPNEELYISDCWDRLLLPNVLFPMNGYINWGHSPYIGYFNRGGQWISSFTSYGNMNCYFLQRHAWYLFARSGERKYFNYAHRYNRITGDYALIHWDAPDKPKGMFTWQKAPIKSLPHYWGNTYKMYDMMPNDIGHWPLEYYLTGDERSKDITMLIGDTFKKKWSLKDATNIRDTHSFLTIRKFVVLYMLTGDEFFAKKSKELADIFIDIKEQTGVAKKYSDYGCTMYKDQRHVVDLYMYYTETGDELGKQAFLKLLNHRYFYNRNPHAQTYQSIAAFAYPIAYQLTGDENYLKVAAQTLRSGFGSSFRTLEEQIKTMPADPGKWRTMPNYGIASHSHPFLAVPAALKFLKDKGWQGENWPVLVKGAQANNAKILFEHKKGRETIFNIHVVTSPGGKINTELFSYPSLQPKLLTGFKTEFEQRILVPRILSAKAVRPMYRDDEAEFQYRVKVTVPTTIDEGLYLLSFGGNESFTVLDSTSEKVALYCPEGYWTATEVEGDGWAVTGQMEAGRLGENAPFYFRVPEGLETLEIFVNRPQIIKAPDGTVVVRGENKNTGKLSIPVRGRNGIWSTHKISAAGTDGANLVYTQLLNIEPVVAFGSPDRLSEQVTGIPTQKVSVVSTSKSKNDLEFVEGIDGKGLRLSDKKSVSFPAGQELSMGGYSFFPGLQGTVEFWYKPDWSIQDIILGRGDSFRVKSFLTGPHAHLGYRYGIRFRDKFFYSDVILELLGELSKEKLDPRFIHRKSMAGKEERYIFKKGEWNHIAYTWAFAEPEKVSSVEKIEGNLTWPVVWRIFGPVDKNDPILPKEVLNSYPEEIVVAGKTFKKNDKVVRQTRYDFPGILKGEFQEKTAYIFLNLKSPRAQKVTLGMGADWWMQAWVNGELVLDTTETSNVHYPFSIWNHTVNVDLKKGDNILAVRYIRSKTSLLALGGPKELRTPASGDVQWEFSIFVNGKCMNEYRNRLQVRFLRQPKDKETLKPSTKRKDVVLGPFDGTMDTLRISDIVRYNSDFVPSKKTPELDENTRALFLFNGNLKGVSAQTEGALEAK